MWRIFRHLNYKWGKVKVEMQRKKSYFTAFWVNTDSYVHVRLCLVEPLEKLSKQTHSKDTINKPKEILKSSVVTHRETIEKTMNGKTGKTIKKRADIRHDA